MKKITAIIAAVAAIFIMSSSVNAKTFAFGVKVGGNFNRLSLSGAETGHDNSAGWEAGIMGEVNLPIVGLGFDLSLMYARMNNSADLDNKDLEPDANPGKNFLMIPLNLKYKISLPAVGSIITPYIFTGPNFNFKLDKKTFKYFKSKTCQVAWNVGVGVELIKHLQIGASYNFGINKVANYVTGTNQDDNVKINNNYWMVTAAYLF